MNGKRLVDMLYVLNFVGRATCQTICETLESECGMKLQPKVVHRYMNEMVSMELVDVVEKRASSCNGGPRPRVYVPRANLTYLD